jgi:2-methylcitrate dehydratase
MSSKLVLPRNSNQARGLARFAIQFLQGTIGNPSTNVLNRTELFHTDSVLCGISALAMRTNAPTLLRDEALKEYQRSADLPSARVFGSDQGVAPEKAIVANCAAGKLNFDNC